jgi:hypothetical protein
MADLKELLGEELFNKVTETLKGKGKEGKDLVCWLMMVILFLKKI